ncbi:hypothetical protein G7Y89_g13710 [Cudoniella acicularis]|uniref:Uncharacterized protein n=1 Tax=Cudoniella acicularis TaxID=354080 RepID=A0A8H4R905_9HELO|nr:hypothetical protein G7Y89_g13710 [Cudoniella acicularis]
MGIQARTSGTIGYAQSLLDRVVSPSTRQNMYNTILTFSQEKPLLASFIFTHLLFSLTPLLLFASFSLGVFLLAAISALLFSLFWIGLALAVLVPTLFVTVGLGVLVWVWAVGSWLVGQWCWGVVFNKAGEVKGKQVGVVNGKGGRVVDGVKEEN